MMPLVVVGPTAVGKTSLALEIAERYRAVVVSMDAMMVYRGMDIGTAKPTPAELARVPHRGIDLREPHEDWSAADFVALAEATLAEDPGRPVLLCGGTTFYLRAFLDGLVAAPRVDPALRLAAESLADPWARLAEVDPALAARLHPHDRVRVVRGLEFFAATGRRLSEEHAGHQRQRRAAAVIALDRTDLYERIDARVEAMLAAGYLEEVRGLLARGVSRQARPMRSLGYEHLAAHVDGELDLGEATRLTKRDTRHFARKQRAFLRGQGFEPTEDPWAVVGSAWGPPPG